MKTIKFSSPKKDNSFFDEVREEVNNYFSAKQISRFANNEMIIKSVFWILIWGVSWCCVFWFKHNTILAFTCGIIHMFTHVMIAFNITHDANHHAMFRSPRLNTITGYFIELLGCNKKMWTLAHNQEHHTFINIHEHDNNIDGYKLLRLCPQDKWYYFHKYQWLYAPIVYGLATINYATVRDVKMFFRYVKQSKLDMSLSFVFEFIFFKIIYYAYLFLIPIFIFGVSFKLILLYFLIGHFINGIFLALIFVTGHLTENTSYPVTHNNVIETNWAIHVIQTTGDYATNSTFMQWFVGGINLHVAHHLFPKICHVHYKNISPIIKNVAQNHGFCYREIPTFSSALLSHFNLLRSLGESPSLEIKENPAVAIGT